jgi:hypothetical protein
MRLPCSLLSPADVPVAAVVAKGIALTAWVRVDPAPVAYTRTLFHIVGSGQEQVMLG